MRANADPREMELLKLQEIAQLSSIYYRNLKPFERNPNLTHVVHAVMNLSQFLCVTCIEIFHHVHHSINRKMREKDPTVPELPEEDNPVFFSHPFCMAISLILAILWLAFRTFQRLIDMTLVGCAVGITLMLTVAIVEMRHAEIYINLDEITDAEELVHPIYIHNFFMCISSIFAMVIYFIHFWIAFECRQWQKKVREWEDGFDESTTSSESRGTSRTTPETSEKSDNDVVHDLDAIPTWETLKRKLSDIDQSDLENEPVILYCCCYDIWRYCKERENRIPIHEFQVVHVK